MRRSFNLVWRASKERAACSRRTNWQVLFSQTYQMKPPKTVPSESKDARRKADIAQSQASLLVLRRAAGEALQASLRSIEQTL